MWQRIQTLFLIIAAIAGAAYFFVPIAEVKGENLLGKNDLITSAVAVAVVLLSLFALTQYKNRKLQMMICLVNMVCAFSLAGTAAFTAVQTGGTPRYEFAVGVPVLAFIALFFAWKNIKKDDDLVKSMDRFR